MWWTSVSTKECVYVNEYVLYVSECERDRDEDREMVARGGFGQKYEGKKKKTIQCILVLIGISLVHYSSYFK